ncbi:MAG: polysaccharide deacetylase family protein [Polyangiales bacterium]
MTARWAALSVDVDEIPCYAAIHGLDAPTDHRAHAIWDRAIPRFRKLFAEEGIPATFFVVARDVERQGNADAARALGADGHEIGSHSLSHFYDLTRRDRATLRTEIREATRRLEAAVGTRPRGFRAPGYTITDTIFDELEADGYAYDSSVFPCPAYYAAKVAAIGLHRLAGRTSRSIVDDPRVLGAPADPYRIGRPYHARGEGLVELPIGVTRDATLRLPYIGTSVVLSGTAGAKALTRAIVGRPLVNLELHGMDLADATEDDLGFLAGVQPDLRRTRTEKEAALRTAIGTLRDAGYRFVTLLDASRLLTP